MAKRHATGLLLALTVLLVYVGASPKGCKSGCGKSRGILKLAPGTQYKYEYHGKIDISVSSADEQLVSTEVKAEVLLSQLADCQQVLQIQNLQVLGKAGKRLGQIPDIQKPIIINNKDGAVEDSICTEATDNQNSLNIKRAIASAFLVNLESGHETDVFGRCYTEVASSKQGQQTVVQKTRDLNRCAFRENIKQDFLATTFNKDSEIKSSPILNADYEATQTIKNGVVDTVQITENYLYLPFSVGQNGAKARVVSKLKLTGTGSAGAKPGSNTPKTIIFDNPHPVNVPKTGQSLQNILQSINELSKTIDGTVSEKTATEYINLIKVLKVSNKDDILTVYGKVKSGAGFADKQGTKKIFIDALIKAGNGDAIEVALQLLQSKELDEWEQRKLFLGLSLATHVSEKALTSAGQLLNQPNLPREAYLGIGNLAGKFCKQHSCDNNQAINSLATQLIAKLGDNKAANKNEETDMIFVLKALANFNRVTDQAVTKVIQLAKDKNAPSRLRVVALETFLADPCQDKLRNAALQVLKDVQLDSEIRIKAYLAAVQCPTAKIGNEIKVLLDKEASYQVGGFIVSHIRNVKASANPDKELQKQHLSFSVPQRFPVDFRKWSYNGEFSYSIDSLGLASATESNVIYSQDSWLPRSASLNLTAEIFGHNINFLEIDTRQENLDRLIARYFGPKGLLINKDLHGLIKEGETPLKKLYNDVQVKLNKLLRSRRDVSPAEIQKISKEVTIKEQPLDKDFDLDLSVKAFGSELFFLNINDNIKKYTPEQVVDRIIKGFSDGLDKLQRFEDTLRTNMLILDAEFNYPTSLGFPLRLALEGAAHVQLKTKGSIDLRALLMGTKDAVVQVELIPSANVEINGRLTVDAFVAENGLKVISSLHTAVGGNLDLFQSANGDNLELKYRLPVEKQTLFSADHQIVAHTREHGQRENNQLLKFAQNKDFSICVDHLKDYVGLEFCGEFSGPNLSGKQVPVLPFPLAGDANVKVEILSEDLKEYVLKQTLVSNAKAELELSTIEKSGRTKAKAHLLAQLTPEKTLKAEFVSPKFSAGAEVLVVQNQNEVSILGKVLYINTEFYGKVGVLMSGPDSRRVCKPILEYKLPDGQMNQLKSLEGQIIIEQNGANKKFIFDNLKLTIPNNNKQIQLKGSLGEENKALFADVEITDGKQFAAIDGRLQIGDSSAKINAVLKNSFNPNANVKVQGELARGPNLNAQLVIIHGADLSSKQNKLDLKTKWSEHYKSQDDYHLDIENELSYPALNMDVKFNLETKPNKFELESKLQYQETNLGIDLESEVNQKEKGDWKVDLDLWGLNNKLELKSSRQINGQICNIANTVVVNGKKFDLKGKVKHIFKPHNIDASADLQLILPTHNNPFTITSVLKQDVNSLDASQKITEGSNVIVDAFLKANKNGNANGNIKVNIKNVLTVTGQIKSNKGQGSSDLLIDILSLKKKIKADSTFTVQPPKTFNVALNLYPIFHQDPKLKLSLSTQNTVGPDSLDSKNTFDLKGKKLVVNLKGSQTGEYLNGKLNGDIEVILPNEQYATLKINREYQRNAEGVINGHYQTVLDYRKTKNQAGTKYTVSGQVRNTKLTDKIYDMDLTVSKDAPGETYNGVVGVKKSKQGDKDSFDFKLKSEGTYVAPLEANIVANCNKGTGDFKVSSKYGPYTFVSVTSQYDMSQEDKPKTGKLEFELGTPSKSIHTVKAKLSGSAKCPHSETGELDLQGSMELFADDYDETTKEPLIDLKAEGSVNGGPTQGQIKGSVTCHKHHPVTVAAGYSKTDGKDSKQISANAALQYDQNKNVKADLSYKKDEQQYELIGQLDLPIEKHRSNKLVVTTKKQENRLISKAELISDGAKWVVDYDETNGPTEILDLKLTNPEGKKGQLYLKSAWQGDNDLDLVVKAIYEPKNFLLDSEMKTIVKGADNFAIKGSLNVPFWHVDKVTYDLKADSTSAAKKVHVDVKSAGKNLLNGDANYQSKLEGGKTIIEGGGTFKLKETAQSGNFKFISQRLTQEKNQERGIDISFDASLGNKAIDAEFKLTNKQLRLLNTYCEDKKDCAHIEIDSKTSTDGLKRQNHELEINIDLRKLGLPHEFGLKEVTNRDGWVVDHTVDVHFQGKDKSKYQYSFYLHPKKTGWSLTTPKRIISLEASAEYPKTVTKEGGRVSLDVVFYMDKKNHAGKKISLNTWVNVKVADKTLDGEIKFSHPQLSRPLSASVKTTTQGDKKIQIVGELDVFAQPNQKMTITTIMGVDSDLKNRGSFITSCIIASPGLGLNIEYLETGSFTREPFNAEYTAKLDSRLGNSRIMNEISGKISKELATILITASNVDLLRGTTKMNLNIDEQIFDTELVSWDKNPVVSHLEIKNRNTIKFDIGRKNAPNKKLVFSAGFIPSQIADVRAEVITPTGKHNLAQASLKLDEANFLKPDFKVDSKKIQETLSNVRSDVTRYVGSIQSIQKEWADLGGRASHDISELMKRSAPNLNRLKDYYSKELKQLVDELSSDKTIKDITDFLHSIFGSLAKLTTEFVKQASAITENVAKGLKNSIDRIIDTLQKDLLPSIQSIVGRLIDLVGRTVSLIADAVIYVSSRINDVLEQYQKEINNISTALLAVVQDVGKLVVKEVERYQVVLKEQYKKLSSEIKALPVFEELKNQYEVIKETFIKPEIFLNMLQEVLNSVTELIPASMPELKDLLISIQQYIQKKVKNVHVDDAAELSRIADNAAKASKRVVDMFSRDPTGLQFGSPDFSLNFDLLSKLPRIGSVKFSPLAHIMKEETSAYTEFLLSLVTTPRKLFAPFPLVGMIGQGQQIFTFDGRQITFPANCNYLLARDALNGHFTLAGTYSNGQLGSITLSDGKDQITIKKGGAALLNNAPTELPARHPGIAVFRDYYTITLKTNSGVKVLATPDLHIVVVKLSGFYHGQIRGLLGNGNNEPFDDYTLPNGKIVEGVSEFGNAYKIGASCAPVNAKENKAGTGADAPACAKLFAWDSPLALCYRFVKPGSFKAACNQGVASGVKEIEETIAKLYVSACYERNIPVRVPEEIAKCKNADQTRNVGDVFSVKLPAKAADIVIVVDTVKSNEQIYKQLVQPLITEISKELHGKAINDVEFHLIAYGGENQWPSHVTVNGKLQFKGKSPVLKFSDPPKHDVNHSSNPDLNKSIQILEEIIHSLKLALGTDLQATTYTEAIKYPFRANAVKSLIAVTGRPCETGKLLLIQKIRALFYTSNIIKLNLITPFDNLLVKDSKKTKDVVGFNNENVFTLSQGKKKPEGSPELYKDLSFDDFCAEFTAKNGGNVFVSNNFLAAKGEAKTFINVAAHNIVDQLTNQEVGMDCECKLTSPWEAQNVCWEVYSKERSNKKTVARG